jgi:hypothetical protein
MTGSFERRSETISRYLTPRFLTFANIARFHAFFHHIDHYRTDYFLWVTASGISAAEQSKVKNEDASEDEADPNGEEG